MMKILKENIMEFHPLFTSHPCAYLSSHHPLAGRKSVTLDDLSPYPYICYEQETDSPRYAEEVLSPPSPGQIIYAHNSLSMKYRKYTTNCRRTFWVIRREKTARTAQDVSDA